MEYELESILNYARVDEDLITSGQPTAGQLALARDADFTHVIRLSLLGSTPDLEDEDAVVRELGMDYLHIPVVWTEPTQQDLDGFFAAMDQCRGRKLYVHCAKNYRVSVFVALYRLARGVWSDDEAQEWVLGVWEPNGVWKAFFDDQRGRWRK